MAQPVTKEIEARMIVAHKLGMAAARDPSKDNVMAEQASRDFQTDHERVAFIAGFIATRHRNSKQETAT